MSDVYNVPLKSVLLPPISGSRPVGGVSSDTEGVPSIGGENILVSGGMTYDELKRIPFSFFELMPKGRLQRDDVLINKDGAQTGKVGFYEGDFDKAAVNEHVFILRTRDSRVLEQRYLYYCILLPEIHNKIERRITGSAQPGLNSQFVKAVDIPLQPLSKQRKIAAILTSIDAAIEKTEALIEKYQQIKAGLMHDLFTRGILPNGQLRPLTDSVETKHGRLPRDWRIGSLLEATDPARQPILTGPFGADLGNNDFVDEGVPVLRIGNVQQGHLDLTDLLFVSERKAQSLTRYKVKAGDLLFARQGATTGRNALASDEADGCLINYHIIRVALDDERCSPLFIEAAFSSEIVKRQVERDKGRGTREGINTAQLTGLAFPLAPIDEQRRIAKILEAHGREQRTAQLELQKLHRQKLGLMQDLLTGRVPVKVGAGETANG
ncbi:restriction endonuclease subunit S [Sulfuritalea sp.]|uniref:restriction endonuclease subunit S n=1 Tax=Sulfuritalea sp. TaxID=2480090 RepID=UPI001ACFA00F|nr:restriction endonuclease subunit S [Sulfuritalea sp.]MBN8476717.1 restriction endonuclease subunit S [Sulfuritalea sp.]